MREYAKVYPPFWTSGTGKFLRGDPNSQLLSLYLITGPHGNMIGVFHCPLVYMAHETGMTIEGASKALTRLIEAGFCTFDEADEVVWVHEMAKYQIGRALSPNDKQVIGIRKQFEAIRQTKIRRGFWEKYREDFHLAAPVETGSPIEAPSMPHRSQEQEQEQEQEYSDAGASVVAGKPADACPYQLIVESYHEHFHSGPRVTILNDKRKRVISARWREVVSGEYRSSGDGKRKRSREEALRFFGRYFGYCENLDWCTGRSQMKDGGHFRATIDNLLGAEFMAKRSDEAQDQREVMV